jgi:signal transduction histidine kinase
VRGNAYPLASEIETTLFRIAQEGLTNAIKHAQADHICVTLEYADRVSLTVSDDGKGFDPASVMTPSSIRTSWGLIGIQERSTLINATLSLDSAPGEGTTFTVSLNEPQEVLNANQSADR